MAKPKSGKWKGLLVCVDRAIKVDVTLDVGPNGSLTGTYTFRDRKYAKEDSSGNLEGTYADDLVALELAGEYSASFHGKVHPAFPTKKQILSGFVQVFSRRRTESAVLVLFTDEVTGDEMTGWDGSLA